MATLNSCPKCGGYNRDLYAMAALFWLSSLARVGVAVVHDEVFGTEASLAALVVILVPWVLLHRLAVAPDLRVR